MRENDKNVLKVIMQQVTRIIKTAKLQQLKEFPLYMCDIHHCLLNYFLSTIPACLSDYFKVVGSPVMMAWLHCCRAGRNAGQTAVKAFASQHCCLGLNSRPNQMWFEFNMGSFNCSKGFFWVYFNWVFFLCLQKPTFPNYTGLAVATFATLAKQSQSLTRNNLHSWGFIIVS